MNYACLSAAVVGLALTAIVLVRRSPADPEDLKNRINELNQKFGQILLFLGVAIAGAALLNPDDLDISSTRVRTAIMWFVIAIFPVLIGILPLKELGAALKWDERSWYGVVVKGKILLLVIAILLATFGACSLVVAFLEGYSEDAAVLARHLIL